MNRLINQPRCDTGIIRKLVAQRHIAPGEFARVFAQQDARCDARFAPAGVVSRFALFRHG
jgi:hypothetical protein